MRFLTFMKAFLSGTVLQWLALSPYSQEVLGSNPAPDWGPSCAVCLFSLCQSRFPPTVQRHADYVTCLLSKGVRVDGYSFPC